MTAALSKPKRLPRKPRIDSRASAIRILGAWLVGLKGRGSRRRLCWVSTVTALVVCLPMLRPGDALSAYARPLVWHVEKLDGAQVSSSDADVAVNPASVVKLATSLWALDKLGPDHRYQTVVYAGGPVGEGGRLDGDLYVVGGADPDFHAENAFLLAAALNRDGVRTVAGRLLVDERFWIGWERGGEGRTEDPAARTRQMATRLGRSLDPSRWDRDQRRAWERHAQAQRLDPASPPQVSVTGGFGKGSPPSDASALVVHRSQPLLSALQRFNVFSNNDIERVEAALGTPADLAGYLRAKWGVADPLVKFESTSGLGSNRMTARLIVRLLRDLREILAGHGHSIDELLPVMGCGPSTLTKVFPSLAKSGGAVGMAAKTGSLINTDGGVAALAGFLRTADGELLFALLAPRSGREISAARRKEADWVAGLAKQFGGPQAATCDYPFGHSDDQASVSSAGLFPASVADTKNRPE